jgi:DNA-binding GntR family transcriptional regulator
VPDSLKPVQRRRPLADVVFSKLRDAIIDDRLKAGQWLRQEALAQELGVSQMPVREALKRLVAEGLAVRIPYKGVKVVEFSSEDIVDILTVRLALECLAVRLAAPLITAEELDALRDNLSEAEKLTGQDQMSRRRQLNTEFHLAVCRASGRRYLMRQIETLWGWFPSVMLYEGLRRQEESLAIRLEREKEEHQAILSALESRDADRAEEEIRRHIRNLSQELPQVLDIPEELVEPLYLLSPLKLGL